MKKRIVWLLAIFWLAMLFAFNACSSDSNENPLPSSSSEAQISSSSSEAQISSSSSEAQISSSSSEVQIPSSSSEAKISSSSSEIQISSSSSEAKISSSSSEIQIPSSSSKAVVSSSSEATSGTFTDERNYREYKWVKIGEQVWMAQNLNYSRTISITGETPCYNLATITDKCDPYGRLYAQTAKTACPVGWRLPTNAEWQALVDFVGEDSGKKLKAQSGWNSGNGTDEYGFAALPGGFSNLAGEFKDAGVAGYWWSSSEDEERGIPWTIDSGKEAGPYLSGISFEFMQRFFSIRCIKN